MVRWRWALALWIAAVAGAGLQASPGPGWGPVLGALLGRHFAGLLPASIAGPEEQGPLARLDGWADAPVELVRSAARGRPPGLGAAVSFAAASPGGPVLLGAAPAGLSAGVGGLVLGAARGGPQQGWRVGGAGSWWQGPSGPSGAPGLEGPSRGDDEQGRAMASAVGWTAIGAPSARLGESQVGAVTLVHFSPGAGRGVTTQVLRPPAGMAGGGFGAALAFLEARGEPRVLAVGAPFETDPVTGLPLVGAVHLFEPIGGAGDARLSRWGLVQTMRPESPGIGMAFGASLAWVDGDLAIGAPGHGSLAPGAGSVFGVSRSGDRLWSLGSPQAGARFGAAVCSLPVAWGPGRPGLAVTAAGRGVVHVHDLLAGAPQVVATLRGRPGGGFGLALAAVGEQLLVGAPFEGVGGVPLAGHVQRFLAGRGEEAVETLSAPSPTIGGEFGVSLAASRGRDGVHWLAVGEPGSHHGCDSIRSSCRPGRVAVFVLP